MPDEGYLIDGARTPQGRYGGALAAVRPDDLAALVVGEALRRSGAPAEAVDEVLLWNAHGEMTEATTANLVAEIDGARLTPPVGCGLLAGTCRAAMLESGEIQEGIVTRDDLQRAARLWLINSVQGVREAVLVEP